MCCNLWRCYWKNYQLRNLSYFCPSLVDFELAEFYYQSGGGGGGDMQDLSRLNKRATKFLEEFREAQQHLAVPTSIARCPVEPTVRKWI